MSEETRKEPDIREDEGVEIPIMDADENTSEDTAFAGEDAQTSEEAPAGEADQKEEPEDDTGSGETKASGEPEEAADPSDTTDAKENGGDAKASGKAEEPKKKTSFFGKKKKEKDKFEQQIEELTDRLKRTMAEFDNFRKRTEKEKASMYVIGARDIVEKILPVVDSFERGLTQAPEEDAFADGMRMIYKQLEKALDDMGVKPIEAVGKEFDPNLHNAVMHVDDETAGDNIIVEEFQKGYTYKDFVVRHSMVKVAN